MPNLIIKRALKDDVPLLLDFIKKLAEFEKLSHEVTATEDKLRSTLFSENSNVEAIIGYHDNKPITFALYFYNYSTFLAKKGLHLEDLFVLPEFRGNGVGKQMLKYLAKLAINKNCGRFEWAVLDWNETAIQFYKSIGAELKKEWIVTRISGNNLINLAK